MKNLLSFFTLAILVTSCGAIKTTPVNIGSIEKTFEHNLDKDKLFVVANNWMVQTFKSAKSIVQFTDKEEGVVIGKYLLNSITTNNSLYNNTITSDIYAIIKLQVKDGITKISIDPYDFNKVESIYITPYGEEEAMTDINGLIENYRQYLIKYKDNF